MHTNHFPTNLSPPVTLKMGSRSPKSNQYFYKSKHCRCASSVKIYSFLQEMGCGQTIFQQSSPPLTLIMGSRSPKSNQFFYMSQQYRCASLVKIYSFLQEIGCRQKPLSNNLSPPVTLKMRSRSPKSNKHFSQSQ